MVEAESAWTIAQGSLSCKSFSPFRFLRWLNSPVDMATMYDQLQRAQARKTSTLALLADLEGDIAQLDRSIAITIALILASDLGGDTDGVFEDDVATDSIYDALAVVLAAGTADPHPSSVIGYSELLGLANHPIPARVKTFLRKRARSSSGESSSDEEGSSDDGALKVPGQESSSGSSDSEGSDDDEDDDEDRPAGPFLDVEAAEVPAGNESSSESSEVEAH